jgi:hypothetical protein
MLHYKRTYNNREITYTLTINRKTIVTFPARKRVIESTYNNLIVIAI